MNNIIHIESIEKFNLLISNLDWGDAFVKSILIISPTKIEPGTKNIINFEANFDIEISFVLPDAGGQTLKLVFEDVKNFNLSEEYEFAPIAKFFHNGLEFKYIKNGISVINCKYLKIEN